MAHKQQSQPRHRKARRPPVPRWGVARRWPGERDWRPLVNYQITTHFKALTIAGGFAEAHAAHFAVFSFDHAHFCLVDRSWARQALAGINHA